MFEQRLLGPRMSYADRVQAVNRDVTSAGSREPGDLRDPHQVAETFIQAAFDALLRLREDIAGAALTPFVDALQKAKAVHIAAARGAFGVGSYTYYGLSRIGKRAFLLDNLGSMRADSLRRWTLATRCWSSPSTTTRPKRSNWRRMRMPPGAPC